MEIGSRLHNFTVTNVRTLPELGARLWELRYDKNGAELCWLDRKDENKAFSIAFRTVPEDSTGVFHILEHAVLCGSERYPVREPFVELLKSSVQTFLNAMTYPDKTVFPVSSRNDQDFLNLIGVYMDAVLHPLLHTVPEILLQEGWRLDPQEDGSAALQGVVLNEMKGAYGSPETVLTAAVMRLLYPDTCYRHDSGGDPAVIPSLTQERFRSLHRRFYHPSNARISLVGSVDLDPVLEKLDSFLRDYDAREPEPPIPLQTAVQRAEETVPYEIGEQEEPEGKTVLCSAALLGTYAEKERLFAASVLADYLAGDSEAPLKRAILDAELGEEVQINVQDGILQPCVSWEIWNTDAEKIPDAKRVTEQTLRRIAEEGLDPERLEACFNHYAFQLRDRDGTSYPRSLCEALMLLDTWLYGGDPADALLVEDALSALSEKLHTGYFEALLRELFLTPEHTVTVVLTPSRTLGAEKRERERKLTEALLAGLSEEERARLPEQAAALAAWQRKEDSPEALASIPMLRLSDLAPAPAPICSAVGALDGTVLLRHETGGSLACLNLHFAVSDLTAEELPLASLLAALLTLLPTARHSAAELQLLLKRRIGRLAVSPAVLTGSDPAHCILSFGVSAACLPEQQEEAASLLSELLTETLFRDRRVLLDTLRQTVLEGQMSLSASGTRFAVLRASAFAAAHGAAREAVGGVSYIRFLKAQAAADETALSGLLERLEALSRRIFTRARLTLGASERVTDETLRQLLRSLPAGTPCPVKEAAIPPLGARREGLRIPAAVGFTCRACNLKQHGRAFSGSVYALANILNYQFLWTEIRTQGGAYGCGFSGREDGDLLLTTYRDPKPGRSVSVFARAADFLRGFCAGAPDLTGSILASVSELDPLLNAETRMAVAEARFLRGADEAQRRRRYEELLRTTPDDLLALADALDELAESEQLCVVAGQAQLDECAALDLRIEDAL